MTDTRDDPRYIRTAALTVLAALLVVASCQVEQPATVVEPEQVTGGAGLDAVDGTERIVVPLTGDVAVEEPSPTTDAEPEVDEVRAAIEALRAEREAEARALLEELQELPPEDSEPIQARPVFTPMTVRPEITNVSEVQQALIREYPPDLRDAGIGGRVVAWFYISQTGQVLDRRIAESSGQAALDEAALKVADVFQFTPAMNRDERVQVWIQLPITFQVR